MSSVRSRGHGPPAPVDDAAMLCPSSIRVTDATVEYRSHSPGEITCTCRHNIPVVAQKGRLQKARQIMRKKKSGRPASAHGRPSAAELAAAIKRGSLDAERELVERYGPALRYVIGREVSDGGAAEDLYQETMLVAIERLRGRGLEQPDKLAPFLLGIARRLVKANRRRESRYLYQHDLILEIADHAPSPEDGVALLQEARVLSAAMSALKVQRDREVLKRCYVLGEDKELVCRAMSLSAEQLNKVLHRARARLRRQIERRRARMRRTCRGD